MKSEAELNTLIKRSLEEMEEVAYKIPDPSNQYAATVARPFDGLGSYKGQALYWESKFSKRLESFNLQRVEDHQIEYLLKLKKRIPSCHTWIPFGVQVARGDVRLYVFTNVCQIAARREARENYRVKELEALPYFSVKKGLVDFSDESRLIRE